MATHGPPGARILDRLSRLLDEQVMGFLALLAIALALGDWVFDFGEKVDDIVDVAQWTIVGIFAVEYSVGLARAPDRKAYLRDPWRMLDLLTVIVPLASILPQVSTSVRSSPGLRLIRLTRAVVMGARFGGVMVRERVRQTEPSSAFPVEVSVLQRIDRGAPRSSTWAEFLEWVREPGGEWYHVANIGPPHIDEVARAAGIPSTLLEPHLLGGAYPHIETHGKFQVLSLWLPSVVRGKEPEERGKQFEVRRNSLVLVIGESTLFTLSSQPADLQTAVTGALSKAESGEGPICNLATLAFLRVAMERNEDMVEQFDRELARLEEIPVRESRPEFLERTFRLKKELSAARGDLWRLKNLLASLAKRRVTLPGMDAEAMRVLRTLAKDADYLYETVVNIRDGLLSLIDLHLNVVSFEMNRVVRLLAVVSVLGLVPAIVGGLLGMNLADNPWPFTLPQVAYAVAMAMVFCFYFFFVKGWLR